MDIPPFHLPPPLPSLTIRPATRADLPDIARIHADAFNDFELYNWILPGRHAHPEQYYRYCLMRDRLLFDEPHVRMLIAEAPRGEVERAVISAGRKGRNNGSGLNIETNDSMKEQRIDKIAIEDDDASMIPLAFTCLEALGDTALSHRWRATHSWSSWFDSLAGRVERAYTRYVLNRVADYTAFAGIASRFGGSFTGIEGLLHVQFLMIGSQYQGLGVGKALLNVALEMGRREGLCVGLESSYAGKKLYEKSGFKVVHEHVLEEWEAGKSRPTTRTPVMVWEPEGREGTWLEEDGEVGWRIRQVMTGVVVEPLKVVDEA